MFLIIISFKLIMIASKQFVLPILICFLISIAYSSIINTQDLEPIQSQRIQMLQLLNEGRAQRGIQLQLYMDDDLESLAQDHSDYLVQKGTYSHFTLDGLSPIDRAQEANFTYTVRSVIQRGRNIPQIYEFLLKSAGNFEHMMDPQNTRVGMGISKRGNQLMVNLLFSTRDYELYPITQDQYNYIHDSIVSHVIQEDQYVSEETPELTQLLQDWIAEGKPGQGHQYLTEKQFFIPGKMALSSTYLSMFPVVPSLLTMFKDFDLDYFVRNKQQLTKMGVGITAQETGRIEIWVYYTS